MKKHVKEYIIGWAVMLAVFNGIVFLFQGLGSLEILPQFSFGFDARFWTCWGCINGMLILHLVCTLFAFSKGSSGDLFLRIPLIQKSYSGCIWVAIVGIACMLIPNCPVWLAVILCVLAFVPTVMGILKAKTAGDVVAEVGQKVKANTFFLKSLTVDAQTLLSRAEGEEIKAECKKVYEAVRYGDPMSHEALASAEAQITVEFAALSDAVTAGDVAAVQAAAREIIILVEDRNRKCKLLK